MATTKAMVGSAVHLRPISELDRPVHRQHLLNLGGQHLANRIEFGARDSQAHTQLGDPDLKARIHSAETPRTLARHLAA